MGRFQKLLVGLMIIGLAAGCTASPAATTPPPSPVPVTATPEPTPTPVPSTATPEATVTPPTATITPTAAPVVMNLDPEDWKNWPVMPVVPDHVREIYQLGQTLGNDPHAFSILGDCQSLPETFLGVYETDPGKVRQLPLELQELVTQFDGSFNRESPTVKLGTTAGAIIWEEWHENLYGCKSNETPLDCELRIHKPAFVIINLGTHWESRNSMYLRKILDQLIANGVVPILSTKADNREGDDRLNLEMAQLAVEYDLPLWNFWAAVGDLPNRGLGYQKGNEHIGEVYLSEEGLERHRHTAIEALNAVWRAVSR